MCGKTYGCVSYFSGKKKKKKKTQGYLAKYAFNISLEQKRLDNDLSVLSSC